MKIPISKRGIPCGLAFMEFMAIAEKDIRSAHGESVLRQMPSRQALEVYDEVVSWQSQAELSDLLESL